MNVQQQLMELLWEVLEGCDYDVEAIKRELKVDDDPTKIYMIDSLDMVEYYVRIQEHFGIVIAQDDYMQLDTIAHIEGYLSDKLAQQAATV
jgi:acyl carrier protein